MLAIVCSEIPCCKNSYRIETNANQLAGFYTIQFFTKKCLQTGYNFIYEYNLMQCWGVEIMSNDRSGKIVF